MNGYTITLDGQPVVRSDKLDIRLTKKQKKEFRKMHTRNGASGTLTVSIEPEDPYKDFKRRMKEEANVKICKSSQ